MYDATRKRLLCGREDMLGLVAAQLKYKVESKELQHGEAVWIDVSLDSPSSCYFVLHEMNANGLDGWWHWVSFDHRQT